MSRLPLCSLCFLLFLSPPAAPAQTFDPAARAAAVAPFLDDQTIAVGHVDVGRLDAVAIAKFLGDVIPAGEQHVAPLEELITIFKMKFGAAGIRELYAVVNLQDIPKEPVFVVAPLAAGSDAKSAAEVLKEWTRLPAAEAIGNTLVAGQSGTLARLKTHRATPRPDLAKAFALAGDTAAQVILAPTDDTRRVIREMLPRLPEQIGGGSGVAVADGVRWAVLSVNSPPKLSLQLTVQAKDETAAAALRGIALSAIQQFRDRQLKPAGTVKPGEREAAEALLTLLTPQLKGDQLVISRVQGDEEVKTLVRTLLPAVQAARTAAGRSQSSNNLKQLGIAMHNFHDAHKHFPPQAIRSKDGKPLLSWRVAVLPYLDQQALYNEFKLDEPWDSEHNKKLIEKLPPQLASPHLGDALIAKGMTSYLVPLTKAPPAVSLVKQDDLKKPITSGKDEMIFDLPQGTTMARILDGTSNTILVLEAHPKAAVIWTKPDDLVIDPAAPLAQLTGQPNGGASAVFADVSVHFLKTSIDPKTFWNLLRMNDLNVVGDF